MLGEAEDTEHVKPGEQAFTEAVVSFLNGTRQCRAPW
jgi:hypothetical protein